MSNGSIWPENAPDQVSFCTKVREEGQVHARADLPWRYIDDPYAVLVSEVMLQQTQVKRVLSYWPRFLELFPTLEALATAETADVLSAWQGLGYNRRALALKRCAEQVVGERPAGLSGDADNDAGQEAVASGFSQAAELPATYDQLVALPGIGPATAAGVQAFARNVPGVYLETNVRTVFLHELFPGEVDVSDKAIAPLVELTCPDANPREWYYNLLDYGAFLKSQVVNPSRRSASYTRQSKFEGSRRQKRSELVRIVLDAPEGLSPRSAHERLNATEEQAGRAAVPPALFDSLVSDLASEGFFKITPTGDLLP